jgi:NCS1 family nucleobase:cation symporter-1
VAINLVGKEQMWSWLTGLYNYAWFVGFFVSGIVYLLLSRKTVEHSNIKVEAAAVSSGAY